MDKTILINRLRARGYKHIESDVFDIAERLRAYDESLLLFYNPFQDRYEVHTCLYSPTYCISAEVLDARLLDKLRMADSNTQYGFNDKIKDIERDKEIEEKRKIEARKDLSREMEKDIKIVAKSTKNLF